MKPSIFIRDWLRFADKRVDFMEGEYFPGGVSLPISILEIALFFTSIVLLFEAVTRWYFWLGLLLLLLVVLLLVGRFGLPLSLIFPSHLYPLIQTFKRIQPNPDLSGARNIESASGCIFFQ